MRTPVLLDNRDGPRSLRTSVLKFYSGVELSQLRFQLQEKYASLSVQSRDGGAYILYIALSAIGFWDNGERSMPVSPDMLSATTTNRTQVFPIIGGGVSAPVS